MCAFLRSITWATSCLWNWFKLVQIGLVALFEKHATATAGPVLISPVQFGFWFFFSPMDWSFKHYRYLVCNESQFYHNFYGHYQNANLWLLRYLLGPIFSRESWENPKILVIINCCLLDGKYLTFSDQIPWCWCALPSVWRSGPIWFLASKMGNWQPQLVAD